MEAGSHGGTPPSNEMRCKGKARGCAQGDEREPVRLNQRERFATELEGGNKEASERTEGVAYSAAEAVAARFTPLSRVRPS